MAESWDIEKIPTGQWFSTRQVAALLGVDHRQVTNRFAPNSPRRPPEGLVCKRVQETRGVTLWIIRSGKPSRNERE